MSGNNSSSTPGQHGVAIPPPPVAGSGSGSMERTRSNSAALSGRLRAASEMQRQGVISKEEKAIMKSLILNNISDPHFREQFDLARKSNDPEMIRRLFKNNNSQPLMNDSIMMDLTDMTLGDVDDFSSFLDDFNDPLIPPTSVTPNPTTPAYFGSATARPPTMDHHHQQHQQHQQQQQQQHHLHQHHPQQQQQHRHSVGFVTEFGAQMAAPTKTNQGRPEYTRKRQASRSAPGQVMTKVNANSAGSAAVPPNGAGPGMGRERVGSRPIDLHTASSAAAAVGLTPGRGRPMSQAYPRPNTHQRASHVGIKVEDSRGVHPMPSAVAPAMPYSNTSISSMHQRSSPAMPMYQHGMVSSHIVGRPGMGDPAARLKVGASPSSSAMGDDDDDDDRSGIAKTRKNERERKRRLAVTQGFDELYKLLKRLEEERQSSGIPVGKDPERMSILGTSKLDKASILRNSIDKIKTLEVEINDLRKDNDRLNQMIQAHHKR
mmetsp:Transcript_860/g.1979  ORF Transcript_860/g.1979 Transcript_860/m.1979 type:complete len:489 (+) Transcript_860:733-2199(+)